MLSPLACLIAIVVIGLLFWMLISLFSKNRVKRYGSAIAIGGLLVWLFFPKQNPLKKYGIDYRFVPMASPTKNSIEFYIDSSNGEIEGPCITGDELIVKFRIWRRLELMTS